jgi:lipoyl synthase
MGDVCTRNCGFCAVNHGRTVPLDEDEPIRIADQVLELGLRFVVITSVTRDDLPDGGADHFARVVRELKSRCNGVGVEVLVPDFGGSHDSLLTVLQAEPDVLAHNVETVPRLHPSVRPQASYKRSLQLLRRAAEAGGNSIVKSGLMVGLGETREEVEHVLRDLHDAGCRMITIGQYLRPSKSHHPVVEYIRPEAFEEYERVALKMGFLSVASAPFVRSSYLAENFFEKAVSSNEKSGR